MSSTSAGCAPRTRARRCGGSSTRPRSPAYRWSGSSTAAAPERCALRFATSSRSTGSSIGTRRTRATGPPSRTSAEPAPLMERLGAVDVVLDRVEEDAIARELGERGLRLVVDVLIVLQLAQERHEAAHLAHVRD